MKTITPEQADAIEAATQKAAEEAAQGVDPDAAVAKQAEELGVSGDFVDRLTQLTNVKLAAEVYSRIPVGEERTASYPQASVEGVNAILSASERANEMQKAAAEEIRSGRDLMSINGWAEPVMAKAAAEEQPAEPEEIPLFQKLSFENFTATIREAEADLARAKLVRKESHERYGAIKERSIQALDSLRRALPEMEDAGAFNKFAADLCRTFGEEVAPIARAIGRLSKIAEESMDWSGVRGKLLDSDDEYLRPVPAVISAYSRRVAAEAALDEMDADIVRRTDSIAAAASMIPQLPKLAAEAKKAYERKQAIFGFLETTMDPVMKDSTGGAPATTAKRLADQLEAYADVADPVLQQKLNSIKARSILSNIMSSDRVLQSYVDSHGPNDVMDAYTELYGRNPSAMTNPQVAKSVLRQYLESSSDPSSRVLPLFNIQQLDDLEKDESQIPGVDPATFKLLTSSKEKA